MKKTVTRLIIFAWIGAAFLIDSSAFAATAGIQTASGDPRHADVKVQESLNEPAGAQIHAASTQTNFGQLSRASQVLGTKVCNQQDEKLGNVKDLMVDVPSGRLSLVVLSSGGLFSLDDRLIPVPVGSFAQSIDNRILVLNIDKPRLQSAPSFAKSNWPDMTDKNWNNQVHRYYGQQQPSFESSKATAYNRTRINEPAGAELSRSIEGAQTSGQLSSDSYGEAQIDLRRDRSPRQGLGAEDLTRNDQKISDFESLFRSDAFIREEAGAERSSPGATTMERASTTHSAPWVRPAARATSSEWN